MSRFQFVADHQDAFEVKRLCELVEVERSSFYAWLNAAPVREARAAADQRRTYCVDRRHRPTPEQGRAVLTATSNPTRDRWRAERAG